MSKAKITLLLTGAIAPNTWDMLKVTDSEVRRRQYIEAITYYLENTNYDLIFVENSGNDISNYFKQYKKRTEFLTYESEPTVPDRGKGYKEMEILQYAYENSQILLKSGHIIKITGRLKIINLQKLIRNNILKLTNQDFIATCIYKEGKMDARCFAFSLSFLDEFLKYKEKVNLKYSFEKALWKSVISFVKNNRATYRQFSENLRVSGVNGAFGVAYDRSVIIEFAKYLRYQFLRKSKVKLLEKQINSQKHY
ncbi:hypothetical protein [Mesonia mobilis]|uniref:hypothetical protein n=1 Tax=Mesonia mobilis TaxID=369791 RepID=UPI0026F1F1D0|nr:hypothetical protein [Mesonia mobilis]